MDVFWNDRIHFLVLVMSSPLPSTEGVQLFSGMTIAALWAKGHLHIQDAQTKYQRQKKLQNRHLTIEIL
jgi:hypothetical protein